MPYTGNPSANNTDAVRLLIFDTATSTGAEIFSNAEITFFINNSPNIFSAACLALNTLGSRFSSLVASTSAVDEKKVGDLMIKFNVSGGNIETFTRSVMDLCKQLDKRSAKSVAPYAGGISRADKKSVRTDTDRVPPFFSREQFDNLGAIDPTDLGSTST